MSECNLCASAYAVFFATAEPLLPEKLSEILQVSEEQAQSAIADLIKQLSDDSSGVELICLNGAYQLATKKQYGDIVKRALEIKKNTPLSQAALEVLAIVAYNQPVTRSFVEQVRGIDSSSVMAGLVEKGLIEESGRLDLPGKPLAYQTTDNFLRCFSMSDLGQLPPIDHDPAKEILDDGEPQDGEAQ